MSDISRSTTIPATQQAIWDVLADYGGLAEWLEGADHSCILNHGPDGTLLGTTRRVQVRRTVFVERVTAAGAPTVLAYDVTGMPKRLGRINNRWTLRAVGDATEVTITSTVEMGRNPLARAAERVVCLGMAKASDTMLADLTRRMENPGG